jgi:hypothetical protein
MTLGARLQAYTAFFGAWFLFFMLVKVLILAEYQLHAGKLTTALVAALVLAKVVLLAQHVSLGAWTQRRPAWLELLVRTALYGAGVLVVLLAERAFELRHEPGDIGSAVLRSLRQEGSAHVMANALCAAAALLAFNVLMLVRGHLGPGWLLAMLRAPRPARHATSATRHG